MRAIFLLLLACMLSAQDHPELERARKTLADWPNLARYAQENAKLSPADGRVVFLGDSITDAWGRRAGKFWPDRP